MLSKRLDKEDILRLVTVQYYSILYYASPLWIGSLQSISWRRINIAHYRALRSAVGFKSKSMKRSELDSETKRAKPLEWAKYIMSSTVIKLYNKSDTNIAKILRNSAYVSNRLPLHAKFIDRSRLCVGRQTLPYRIGHLFSKISFDWIVNLSDDALRKSLKKEFFEYFD